MNNEFLPVSRKRWRRGIEQLDYIVVTPDAYVDQFAAAVSFAELGCSVGIIAQPNWESAEDLRRAARYAFLLSSGNIDGIVNMYRRQAQAQRGRLFAGRQNGPRPSPTIATPRLKQAYKDIPVIIGGWKHQTAFCALRLL